VTGVPELRVRLLGGLAVEGVPVLSLGSRKARAVLRRLAVAAGGYVAVEDLVDSAWPEGAPVRAADQLAVLVSRLRGVVGAERLPRHPAGYALRADWLDTAALREHVQAAEAALARGDQSAALTEGRLAVELLLGPLLPEDESESVLEERTAVERLAARARLVTSEAALRSGSAWEALEQASRSREDDPYDEAALRLHLRALAATSRPAVAVTTYLEAAALLRDELGTEPEPATQQVYLDLLREEPVPRDSGPRPAPALAGREKELRRLQDAWTAAAAGSASLVVVEGPAGIGKSTLLGAFQQQLDPPALTLRAAPDVLGAELPLQPVLDALRVALSDVDVDVDTALGADRELLAPLVGQARTPTSTASTFAAVTTGAGRAVLLAALEALVGRLGEQRPVLLLVDDAHLTDETTTHLLHRCTREGTGHRLLVVAAARPDEGQPWHGDRLALGGLERSAVAQVVGEKRADELWARSGGHPLFLSELARHEGDQPPASVLAAVAGRCAGTDEVAETLRAAAVLGAPDDLALLTAVRGVGREEVLSHLEAGVRQALLAEDSHGFAFAHAMFREAFAAGVGPTRAAALHLDAAHELSRRRTADPMRVAHHADLGGDPNLAARSLTTAAQLASQRYEHGEAANLLDRAVDLEDTPDRRLARARVLLVLGRYAEAERDADEALSHGAGAPGLEVAALVAYYERDLERALELADEAAHAATDPELAAGCWCLAGRVLLTIGRLDEALNRLAEAADLATGPMRAVAAVWRANTLSMQTGDKEAYRLARSATASSARNDPAVEPYRALALGRALTTLDRPYEALQAFEHLAQVVERQQISRFAGRADNYRSWVLRNLGAQPEAKEATEAAWEQVGPLRDIAHAEAYSHAALDLVDAALRDGDLTGAEKWLERRAQAPTSPHVMRWRIDLRHDLLRGRWALATRDLDLADELAARVRADADERGVLRYTRQAQVLQARSSLSRGGRVDLDELQAIALALAESAPLESWWLLGELAQDTGEQRLRALAGKRVDVLVAGAGPYAEPLRAAAHRLLEN